MKNRDIKQPTAVMLIVGFGVVFLFCIGIFVGVANSNIYFANLAAVSYTIIAFPLLNIVVGLVFKFTGYYDAGRVHLIVGVALTALLLVWWIYRIVIIS